MLLNVKIRDLFLHIIDPLLERVELRVYLGLVLLAGLAALRSPSDYISDNDNRHNNHWRALQVWDI